MSIVHLAINDELTKILNKSGFKLLAQYSLNVCIRHGFTASLVYYDLNNFKSINDKFGHIEGDTVLIAFAMQLMGMLRESDVCTRIGGGELLLCLAIQINQKMKNLYQGFIG